MENLKKFLRLYFVVLMVGILEGSLAESYAEEEDSWSSWDQAYDTADDTANFDGGYGSTINTSADYGDFSVPDPGEGVPVGYYDEDGNYYSY